MSVLSRLAVAAANFADPLVKTALRYLVLNTTVAGTGSTYADAAALTSGKNLVTLADGAVGVMLPPGELDMEVKVVNTVANQDLLVYPNSGGQINALTATTQAFTVVGGAEKVFHCDVGGTSAHWYVAAGNLTGTATSASTAELNKLYQVTGGTLAASKAVVVDSNSHMDALHATTLGAGKSGTAGLFDVYPTTTSKGKLRVTKADNTNNDTTTLAVDLHGQATTVHVPDSGASAAYVVQSTAAMTLAEADVLHSVTAGTSAPSKALVLDSAESLVWATTDSTASETVTLSIQDTRTGAGADGWTQKLELVSNVALGSYANAGYNLVTFGSSGRVTGLAAGTCGEVELSAGTTSGTYAALEAELTANAAVSTGTDTGFIYANIAGSNGTGKTTINTNGHFAVLGTGVVNTADGLFDEVSSQVATATARLRIKIGAAVWYIPLCANSALN